MRVAMTLSFMIAVFTAIAVFSPEADADSAPLGPSDRRHADTVRKDAGEALSRGEFARARALYEQVSYLDHTDAHAVREAGRAALAQGDLVYAVDALTRADALAGHAPDPELHYLCGEALYALGRGDEGRREHVLVERDLDAAPPTRQTQLWLARVYARRGELARSELCYRWLAAAGQPVDVEIALHHAESDLLARDFRGAERVLHELLAQVPDHRRARELLAASLEGSGDLDGELAVREDLTRGEATSRSVFDYGRALERAGDWAGALSAYRRASALAGPERTDPELASALGRMTGRTSVELAASAEARSDPQATGLGEQIGAAVPFGRAHHVALGAWREQLTARDSSASGWAGELAAAVALHGRRADAIAGGKLAIRELSTAGGSADRGASWSGFADLRGRPSQHLELSLDTEVNALWRETPRTLLDGGRTTGATVHAYGIALGNHLIIDSGAQGRSLAMPGPTGGADPTASQLLGWTGFDAVLWVDYEHPVHGEILDNDMLWPAYLAGALVAGYRHFELWSDAPPEFTRQIAIAPRASIDEGTLTGRKVFAGGRLGAELRSLLGWDHARQVAISRIGGSLLATTSRSSRISVSLDLGVESPTGFRGQTRTGWVSYHADL